MRMLLLEKVLCFYVAFTLIFTYLLFKIIFGIPGLNTCYVNVSSAIFPASLFFPSWLLLLCGLPPVARDTILEINLQSPYINAASKTH